MSTTKELADLLRKRLENTQVFRRAIPLGSDEAELFLAALDRLHAYETAGGDGEIAEIEKRSAVHWSHVRDSQVKDHWLSACTDRATLLLALKKSRADGEAMKAAISKTAADIDGLVMPLNKGVVGYIKGRLLAIVEQHGHLAKGGGQ